MMILLQNVLPAEDVARARRELGGAVWRDGKATAGAAARPVKSNLQAAGTDALGDFLGEALRRHPLFDMAARPRRLSKLLLSRYEPGMTYGRHTDDALMGPPDDRFRADLAFTLFLSDPETYEGGALIVESPAGEQAVKLAAGDAVLYRAGTIHHVEPVRSGERLAAVGWAQSLVRDSNQREVLFDLSLLRARLNEAGVERDEMLALDKTISNLLRMWAEF